MARAASLGIEILAITDHDTTEAIPSALAEAVRWPIRVVPGVEISTISGREEIHLLGFLMDLTNPELQGLLTRTREARWVRAREMLNRLANLGIPVDWERVIAHSGGGSSIGRPHVAASMLEAGHVSSWDEAFDLWIGRDRPAYVERYKLEPEAAIQLVRRSGGVAVLAHPFIYDRYGERKASLDLGKWLPRLREAGLDGIEVYYPNYTRKARRQLLALAIEHGLLITGGSDYHGGMFGHGLGKVPVPWAAWKGLERRHKARQTEPAYRRERMPVSDPFMQPISSQVSP